MQTDLKSHTAKYNCLTVKGNRRQEAGEAVLIAAYVISLVSCNTVSKEECTSVLLVYELTGGYDKTTQTSCSTGGLALIITFLINIVIEIEN